MGITRADILRLANSIPPNSVLYDMGSIDPRTGRRKDCSGWVSFCWQLDAGGWGGETTASLVTKRLIREIPRDELLQGDAVGICGTNTGGAGGHIMLFMGWVGAVGGSYRVTEMYGGALGPAHRTHRWPHSYYPDGPWRAWRYVGIIEDAPVAAQDQEEAMFFVKFTGEDTIYARYGMNAVPMASPEIFVDTACIAREHGLLRETTHKDHIVFHGVKVRLVGVKSLVGKIVE